MSVYVNAASGQPMKSESGRITSPIIGLFNRTTRMLESGIKPIYVFGNVDSGLMIFPKSNAKKVMLKLAPNAKPNEKVE